MESTGDGRVQVKSEGFVPKVVLMAEARGRFHVPAQDVSIIVLVLPLPLVCVLGNGSGSGGVGVGTGIGWKR